MLTFSPDVDRQCIEVPIIDDLVSEDPEMFVVIISSDDPDASIDNPEAPVTIVDDDSVTIGLEMEVYSASEDVSSIEVCAAIVVGMLDREALVTLSTEDSTAEGY